MKIVFIRHGKTHSNTEGRYIGRTDEPLCALGEKEIKALEYPAAGVVICSPMLRCLETAALIYPGMAAKVYEGLRECDFGKFEGKNYAELNGDPAYQEWIDSGGTLPFPGGESVEGFKARCVSAFEKAVSDHKAAKALAFIVHGGTIMAVMEKYAGGVYFDYQVKNGHGYIVEFKNNIFEDLSEI